MGRVRGAVPSHRRRKKLLKQAKGYRGARGTHLRKVHETVIRAKAYRKQKKLKGVIRKLGRQRLRDHAVIADLVRDALVSFGGTSALAQQWRRLYEAANEAGNWNVSFSCLSALQNLVIAADTSPEYDDMGGMLNEDLILRVAAETLESSPEVVEFFARGWGWLPPPDWQSNCAATSE